MTNKEALLEVAQVTLSDAAVEKAFTDATDYGLTSGGTYSSGNAEAIDWIAIDVLSNYLAADISEGDYSISYKTSIETKIRRLKDKWGFDATEEFRVQDASFLW